MCSEALVAAAVLIAWSRPRGGWMRVLTFLSVATADQTPRLLPNLT